MNALGHFLVYPRDLAGYPCNIIIVSQESPGTRISRGQKWKAKKCNLAAYSILTIVVMLGKRGLNMQEMIECEGIIKVTTSRRR